jgi:hypothetical protein
MTPDQQQRYAKLWLNSQDIAYSVKDCGVHGHRIVTDKDFSYPIPGGPQDGQEYHMDGGVPVHVFNEQDLAVLYLTSRMGTQPKTIEREWRGYLGSIFCEVNVGIYEDKRSWYEIAEVSDSYDPLYFSGELEVERINGVYCLRGYDGVSELPPAFINVLEFNGIIDAL